MFSLQLLQRPERARRELHDIGCRQTGILHPHPHPQRSTRLTLDCAPVPVAIPPPPGILCPCGTCCNFLLATTTGGSSSHPGCRRTTRRLRRPHHHELASFHGTVARTRVFLRVPALVEAPKRELGCVRTKPEAKTSTKKKDLAKFCNFFDFWLIKKFNCNEWRVGAPPFLAIFWGKPAFEQLHFSLTSHSLPKIPAVLPRSGHSNLFDFASNPEIFFHPLPAAASTPPPVHNLRFRPLDLYFLRENTTVSLRRNRCKSKVL